jgi:hypothetical protein
MLRCCGFELSFRVKAPRAIGVPWSSRSTRTRCTSSGSRRQEVGSVTGGAARGSSPRYSRAVSARTPSSRERSATTERAFSGRAAASTSQQSSSTWQASQLPRPRRDGAAGGTGTTSRRTSGKGRRGSRRRAYPAGPVSGVLIPPPDRWGRGWVAGSAPEPVSERRTRNRPRRTFHPSAPSPSHGASCPAHSPARRTHTARRRVRRAPSQRHASSRRAPDTRRRRT